MRARTMPILLALMVGGLACGTILTVSDPQNGTDGGGSDAHDDARAEAGTFPDATDAGMDADAGPAIALCSTPHTLCDDFERATPVFDRAIWTATEGDGGHSLSTDRAKSGSTSLLVDLLSEVGTDTYYTLRKSFIGPLSTLRCSFALYITDYEVARGIPISIALGDSYTASLWVRPNGDPNPTAFVRDPSGDRNFVVLVGGVWHDIAIEVPALKLFHNGVEVSVPAADSGASGSFDTAFVDIGIVTNPESHTWRALIDNVVCDTK